MSTMVLTGFYRFFRILLDLTANSVFATLTILVFIVDLPISAIF